MVINNYKQAVFWGGLSYPFHCIFLALGALIFRKIFGEGIMASAVGPLVTPFLGGTLVSFYILRLLNGIYNLKFILLCYAINFIIAIIIVVVVVPAFSKDSMGGHSILFVGAYFVVHCIYFPLELTIAEKVRNKILKYKSK